MDANETRPFFTAIIRWRGPDPAIEIETRHPGFSTPEEAALFANVILPESPLGLRLASGGALELLLPDGRYLALADGDVIVWRIPTRALHATDFVVANDNDFEPHPFSTYRPPRSALGDYEQAQYAVLDPNGTPIDVLVEWDEAEHLKVTVQQTVASDEQAEPAFAIGSLPEA